MTSWPLLLLAFAVLLLTRKCAAFAFSFHPSRSVPCIKRTTIPDEKSIFKRHQNGDVPWSVHSPPFVITTSLPLFQRSTRSSPLPFLFSSSSSSLSMIFGKMFEESGPLGKGITVGKIQVALDCSNRSSSSILGILRSKAGGGGTSQAALARLTNDVCLAILRKSTDWVGACSDSKWFSGNDGSGAESLFNRWANKEASKFEKEYVPGSESDEKGGGATIAVVSLLVEIQGDATRFDGAGFSIGATKEVLSSIASDCQVDRGSCINAAEVFWTPSANDEVLTKRDVILDFPEIIDL